MADLETLETGISGRRVSYREYVGRCGVAVLKDIMEVRRALVAGDVSAARAGIRSAVAALGQMEARLGEIDGPDAREGLRRVLDERDERFE